MPGRSIGIPYKHFHQADDPFDVVVVGSGMGGLSAAALLSKIAGLRVLVLERHFTAGGFTHVFHRPRFEWDVGVHYVGELHCRESPLTTLFEYISEGRVTWQPMPDAYDRIVVGDASFDYVAGEERLRDALLRRFPGERAAIDRYFAAIRRLLRAARWFYSDKALPPLLSRFCGAPLRYPFLSLARRTTADVLASCGASPMLRAVLAGQWGDYGVPPAFSSFGMHGLTTQHYFAGGAYPVGGASEIARSLLPTIERHGGAIVVDAAVTQILVEGGRAVGVRLQDGREFRARSVVSAVGLPETLRLTPAWTDGAARPGVVAAPPTEPPSPAHLCLYVGLRSGENGPVLTGTNLWIHPTADYERNWAAFAADLEAEFPLLFISFPSAKDPTFAQRYPGRETIQVVTLAAYERFAQWADTRWKRRGAAYEDLKARLAERLRHALFQYVPAAVGRIEVEELSTPLSTRHFAGHAAGEIYGLAHSPARFVDFRLRPSTPVKNLFLTGQDITTCSVMGAFVSGVVTASAMLHRNLYLRLPRPAAPRRPPAHDRVTLASTRAGASPSIGAIE